MRHIYSVAIFAIKGNIQPVQEYLTKGYYPHKIILNTHNTEYVVVILNIDRESIVAISKCFSHIHIIYGANNEDISNLVSEYGLEEWIETFETYLSERFDTDRRCRLLCESINAAPFRRYMCRGQLYGGIKF